MSEKQPVRIAIFASGTGTNARQLLQHFKHSEVAKVSLVVSNRRQSGVFESGPAFGVPTYLLTGQTYRDGELLVKLMAAHRIQLIVLAGYLKLIPPELVQAFPRRIVNIHPSLLPRHGGQGMYGPRVHEAVLNARDPESGITIHYVDEVYDQGEIILQEKLTVDPAWNAAQLQQAIHQLEYQHFPQVVEKVCREMHLRADKS